MVQSGQIDGPEGVSLLRTSSFQELRSPSRASTSASISPESPARPTPVFLAEKQEGRRKLLISAIASCVAKSYVIGRRLCARRTKAILFVIGGLVFVFILALASASKAPPPKNVEPPKPPPHWESYALLKSPYNGVYNLVNRTDDVPEWPRGDRQPTAGDISTRHKFVKSRPLTLDKDTTVPDIIECGFSDFDDGDGDKSGVKRETPRLRVFDGIPAGFPEPGFGSIKEFRLDDNVCYERYGRYSSYGFGYSKEEGGMGIGVREEWVDLGGEIYEGGFWAGTMPIQKIDWRGVDWGKLQDRCVAKNKKRFWQPPKMLERSNSSLAQLPVIQVDEPTEEEMKGKVPRTAILFRMWDAFSWEDSDIVNLRALISEASIMSGGQYQIFLLVHVKDDRKPIYANPQVYEEALKKAVPEEFRSMAVLWNENLSRFVYNDLPYDPKERLPVHGIYRASMMPVTIFSQQHPEFQFVYNWELDARGTGHYLDMLSKLDKWAERQPREGLWERSGRFYIPSVHGTWEEYTKFISDLYPNPIWGPIKVEGVTPQGPKPPSRSQKDWGVGEPADVITFGPLFNVHDSRWNLRNDLVNFPKDTPARATIVAHSRLSRRLLRAMHIEMGTNKRMIGTEMVAPTIALLHGFKAAFAPHAVFFERDWPPEKLNEHFNAGKDGQAGRGEKSVFGMAYEHNFNSASWYFNAAWAEKLYKRWVGETTESGGGREWEREHGRMCLPAIWLHPVKKVVMGGKPLEQ